MCVSHLLSIGMMVKNEEKNLDKCLKSLMPILENLKAELIIVDTGSEDSTIQIAQKYTDKIYYHKWNFISIENNYHDRFIHRIPQMAILLVFKIDIIKY